MDIVAFIAERKIETAISEGQFDDLSQLPQVDCSLQGEAFIAWWFRTHYTSDARSE